MNYPLLFGRYYRFLGWFSLTCLVVSVIAFYWTQSLHIDPSFLIWLWLGKELKEKKNSARKWAVGLSIFFLLVFAISGIFSFGKISGWGQEFPVGTLEYNLIISAVFLLVIAPGLLLISPKAKRQFTN